VSEGLPIVAEVERAIVPVLSRQGYELYFAEYVPRQKVLRLYIDSDKGVGIDDCQRVSRLVGDVMDAEGIADRIDGRFNLEVSSPGLDRLLVKPAHFQKYVSRRVQVATFDPIEGRRKFPGELKQASEHGIEVVVDGKAFSIAYGQIERARLVPEF
jgi:ribosome maturation factor RimP